jgi:hypothetical protein
MDEPTPTPTAENTIGHVFHGCDVHRVCRGPGGRQFIVNAQTGECAYGEGACKEFLAPDQTWRSTGSGGGPHEQRVAVHEAGHAVICIDERARAEFVTVVPTLLPGSALFGKRMRIGYCCYDYRLPQWLSADPATWGTRIAKMDLGGPEADDIYFERRGAVPPQETRDGWRNDLINIEKHVAESLGLNIRQLNENDPRILSEIGRLQGEVETRLRDPAVWAVVEAVANRLVEEGAIDGRVVADLLVTEGAIDGHRVACLYSARVTSQ